MSVLDPRMKLVVERQRHETLAFLRKRGVSSPIKQVVVVKVERVLPLVSPTYDGGATEEEVRRRWEEYWRSIDRADATPTRQ